jgi:hypothetical protein
MKRFSQIAWVCKKSKLNVCTDQHKFEGSVLGIAYFTFSFLLVLISIYCWYKCILFLAFYQYFEFRNLWREWNAQVYKADICLLLTKIIMNIQTCFCLHFVKHKTYRKIFQIKFLVINYTRAIWKARGLAAVRRCYAEGGGDCYVKL